MDFIFPNLDRGVSYGKLSIRFQREKVKGSVGRGVVVVVVVVLTLTL